MIAQSTQGAAPGGALRVLRVADVPGVATAGMSGFMLSSGAEIERLGHSVAYWFREDLCAGIASNKVRRLLVPWLIVAKVIAAAVRGNRYDVVEIHEPLSGLYALVARVSRGALPACAVLSHGLEDRYWRVHLSYARARRVAVPLKSRISVPLTLLLPAQLGLRTAAAVLVVSSADRDHLVRTGQVRAERVTAVFGGVSEELFAVERNVGAGARLLFLGSWIERKGTHELTAAWRRLAAARPQVRLTIAGVGDEGAAELVELPGVEVIPTVAREELPDLLARHDVYVLPSWFEGMPLAMLEAAAAGLACVVCGLCGNLDAFRPEDPEGDGGILVPPGDPEALFNALLRIVDDDDLRRRLGPRARERARLYTWKRNAERCVAAYMTATGRRGLGGVPADATSEVTGPGPASISPSGGRPSVSVVIATRDRPELLRSVASAVTEQLEVGDELIVVDDTDKDPGDYGWLDPRCSVLLSGGGGPARARNIGWRAASGEIVAFTDDDVELGDRWVEAVKSAFEGDQELIAVEGHTSSRAFDPLYEYSVHSNTAQIGLTCNVAYRRSALHALNGFDEAFRFAHCEDFDLFTRACALGKVRFGPAMIVDHPPRPVVPAAFARRGAWIASDRRLYEKHPGLRPYPLPPLACAIIEYGRWPVNLFKPQPVRAPKSDAARMRRAVTLAVLWWGNALRAIPSAARDRR